MSSFVTGLLFGFATLGIVSGCAALVYWRLHNAKKNAGAKIRLLTQQYHAMTHSAADDVSMDALGQQELISSRMEFRKIEAIEAELTGGEDRFIAQILLKEFFKSDDDWVKARAAKALYPLDPRIAFGVLKVLAKNSSPYVQLPGIWALGEINSEGALELLISMVWNKNPDIQRAVIRCLILKQTKHQIPFDYIRKVKDLMKEVRYKTDWIL